MKNKNTGSKNDPNAMREHDSPVSSFTSVELLNLRTFTAFHQQLFFLLIWDRHPCRGLDRHQLNGLCYTCSSSHRSLPMQLMGDICSQFRNFTVLLRDGLLIFRTVLVVDLIRK